jgi:hydroxyacylglutathione hydrolase
MLSIYSITAFSDNYIWMLRRDRFVAFIDPGEAHRVLEKIQFENLTPVAILITHHPSQFI